MSEYYVDLGDIDAILAAQDKENKFKPYVAPKITSSVTSAPVTSPFAPATSAYEEYIKTLDQGADYYAIDDIDKVDDFYDTAFQDSFLDPSVAFGLEIGGEGGGVNYISTEQLKPYTQLTKNEYLAQGAPKYLSTWTGRPSEELVADTYGKVALTDADSTREAVSNYYGYNIQPSSKETNIADFGGNYTEHTNASQEKISEFQSIIQPIMKEQVAYLQATEGLSFQDALIEAYNRDPMVQALYAKYDVTPFRQTKDGSTYLYDPITFSEIRPLEVKDTGLQDGLKALAIMVATAGAGSALGGYLAASTSMSAPLAKAVGSAVASAGSTAATGGDTSDILRSAILAGAGGYREGLVQVAEGAEALALQGTFSAQSDQLLSAAAKAASDIERFDKVVNTAKFVNAAVNDDVLGGFVDLYGQQITNGVLDKLNLDQKTLDAKYGGIQRNDMVAGLVKMQRRLAGGADFESALMDGFGTYVRQGGTLGIDIDTPEFIERIGDIIKETGSAFDDFVLQPPKEAVEALLSSLPDKTPEEVKAIEDYVKTAGSAFDDAVLQPPKEVAEKIYEAVEVPTGTTPEGPEIPKTGSMSLPSVDADLDLDFDFQAPEFGKISEGLFSDYLSKYADPGLLERKRFRGYTAPQGMFRNIV